MSKRIRSLITFFSLGLLSSHALAVSPGFYMGLNTGPATNSGGTQQAQMQGVAATTPVTPESSQWGTSVIMGYKANPYAGMEGGFTYFSSINYDTKDIQTCSRANVRVRNLHVVGKLGAPLGNSFEIFAKAGAAVVYQSTSGSLSPDLGDECGKTTYSNTVKPTFGAGASYDLSQNWVADLTYTNQPTSGVLSSVSMIGLGLTYHFVDQYCGQFLC